MVCLILKAMVNGTQVSEGYWPRHRRVLFLDLLILYTVSKDRNCMWLLCKATASVVACILKSICKVMVLAQFKQFCSKLSSGCSSN